MQPATKISDLETWFLILTLPLPSSAALGKSLHLSEPWFLHLLNGGQDIRLNERRYVKVLHPTLLSVQ